MPRETLHFPKARIGNEQSIRLLALDRLCLIEKERGRGGLNEIDIMRLYLTAISSKQRAKSYQCVNAWSLQHYNDKLRTALLWHISMQNEGL